MSVNDRPMRDPQLQIGSAQEDVKSGSPRVFPHLRNWISSHPGKSGTLAGWYQQGCGLLATGFTLPLVVRHLTVVDYGVWFSFQGFLGMINLTDFGLSFVLTRQIAYSLHMSEAGGLSNTDFIGTRSGWEGVRDVYEVSRRIFHGVSAIAIVLLALLYFCMTHFGKLAAHIDRQMMVTWCLLGTGAIISLESKASQAVLEGLAKVYVTRFVLGNVQLLTGIGVVAALLLGGNIVTLSAVVCSAAAFQWFCLRYVMWRQEALKRAAHAALPKGLLLKFYRVAFPMGILNLSSYSVSSVQVPLVGMLLGPRLVLPFYLAQKIGQTLSFGVAQLFYPQMPLFTRELANGSRSDAARRMKRLLLLGTAGSVAANLFFWAASPIIVALWGRHAFVYVDGTTLALMSVDYLLLGAAVVWAQFVFASGRNPFVSSTVLNGALNLFLICFLCPGFGLMGLPLASLISGLLTNYWYSVFKGVQLLKELRLAE
jgi:O-antigen/teichoic acid export membrane protein